VNALRNVLDDQAFKIQTPTMIKTRKSAEEFMKWSYLENSASKVSTFTKKLTESLQKVIDKSKKSFPYNREKIWKQFYLLRTSNGFSEMWRQFLPTTKPPVEPVLYQHLTDLIFQNLINSHFKIVYLDQEQEPKEMNLNERNVLRYIAGYVCRKLRTKLERENHELKEEMVLCLVELIKDSDMLGADEGTDEDWTNLVDRGGLCHVKTTTYKLFCAMEYQLRESLSLFSKTSLHSREKMAEDIATNEDVQFYWLISSADFDVEDQSAQDLLLRKIAKEFVTVRVFAKTGAWMEKFKQSAKKSTQRTRSFRSELCNTDDD